MAGNLMTHCIPRLIIRQGSGHGLCFQNCGLGALTHPNTVCFRLKDKAGNKCQVTGSSIGGGQVVINGIDNVEVELTGNLPTLLVPHKDQPGVIAKVSGLLADKGVNVATMQVFRYHKGGTANMVLECDQAVEKDVIQALEKIPSVYGVRFIDKVL
jgi:L-serine dehydratase